MSLPTVNFLHLTESKKKPGQDFQTHSHYGQISPDKIFKLMVKGQIKIKPWCYTPTTPKQCPYQVSTSYTSWFSR